MDKIPPPAAPSMYSMVFEDEPRQPSPQNQTQWFSDPIGSAQDEANLGSQITHNQYPDAEDDFDNEPPLLEELGINFQHIFRKTLAVLEPTKSLPDFIVDDADLAGPLVFCFLLGFCLLLRGNVHFGYIFGFGVFGCAGLYFFLNLMSQKHHVDLMRVCSTVGYCLLPVIPLALLSVIFDLRGFFGLVFGVLSVGWSTFTCSRLFEKVLDLHHQRILIAYPICLFYICFAMISVF